MLTAELPGEGSGSLLLCDSHSSCGWWVSSFTYISLRPKNALHVYPENNPIVFTLNDTHGEPPKCSLSPTLFPIQHHTAPWLPRLICKFDHVISLLQNGFSLMVSQSDIGFQDLPWPASRLLSSTVFPHCPSQLDAHRAPKQVYPLHSGVLFLFSSLPGILSRSQLFPPVALSDWLPWRSGWESTCQCRGHGFKPWSGKIPHAAEQLSLCATATKPVL